MEPETLYAQLAALAAKYGAQKLRAGACLCRSVKGYNKVIRAGRASRAQKIRPQAFHMPRA